MPGSPVTIATMASGQVHLANSGGTAALDTAAGGLDLRVIGTFTSRIPFDLVVRSNIKSPKDLRGKRVGVQVIDATVVDSAFSSDLKQRGFPTLVELSKTNIPFVSNAENTSGIKPF